MYKKPKKGMLGIVITIIILILLVFLSNINIAKLSYIENAFSSLVMPIQNSLTYMKNKIAKNNTFFSDINNLKNENKELKDKNSQLEQSLRELESIKAENDTLKEALNLTQKYGEYKTISGYVINRDVSNYSSVLVINIGKKDGIEPNMTVIADKGLVGHVISVTDNTAKVQTIVDPASAVTCKINASNDTIVAKGYLGEKSTLKGTYIPTDANLVQNDNVETSGMGGIYPKGINIGKIKEIINTKNITDRYIKIETAVNFEKIDTVLVITR